MIKTKSTFKSLVRCKTGIKYKLRRIHFVATLLPGLFGSYNLINAQDYPFTLPDTIHATLDVQTNVQEAFKNPILGYNIMGFNTSVIGELRAIKTSDRLNWKVGIDGLEQLNKAKKAANQGVGYDVVWTFNMSADGPDFDNGSPESVAFYESLIARGLEVKDIEMGNECFYPSQRSSIIPNATEYIARAKSMYAALKAKDSTLQLSIPLLRRGSFVNPNWNADLTKDMSYFDAITVHTYIGSDPDNAANSDEAYSTALTARKSLASSTNDFVRPFSKDKPIWLTEWGVQSGGPNAASVLGMADCYLFMAENQNIYHRANWFSVNGKLNSFLVWENYNSNGTTKQRIKYPLEKTGYGSTHEILKSIFENSTMLESDVTTTNLVAGVKAVNARAVTKDGITTIFAINLTDKPAVFNLNLDGTPSKQIFLHEAMAFDNVAQEKALGIDANPLSVIKDGQGEISLPPLSLNKITLKGEPVPVEYAVNFIAPANAAKMDMGTDLVVEASAGNAVTGVSLFMDDVLVRSISSAPYKWGEDTSVDVALKNMQVGFHKLKLIATNADTESTSDSITIEVVDTSLQYPFAGIIAIPGKFEAENYDQGGEGFAYHDSDDNNQSGELRTDGVDIGTGGSGYTIGYTNNGEWLEYTIDVAEDALYEMHIFYASGRPGGGAVMGADFVDEGVALNSAFPLQVTGSWGNYINQSIGKFELTKGKHVLRITVVERGFNLDWIEFKKANDVGTENVLANSIHVYPNPSSNGQFNLYETQKWEVYSLGGSLVLKGEGSMINLGAYNKGLYLLKANGKFLKLIYR